MKRLITTALIAAFALTSCDKEEQKNLVQVDLSFTGESNITSAKIYDNNGLLIDLREIPVGASEVFSLEEGWEYNFVLITENAKVDEAQRVTVYTSFSGLFRKQQLSPTRSGNTLTVNERVSTVKY